MVQSRRVTVARARPFASRSRAKPSMSARRTENRASDLAAAPAGELTQVQGVRLAGQAAVPGQETGEGEPFSFAEGGLDRGERGRWGGSGHRAPPGRAGTGGKLGQSPAPAVETETQRSCPIPSRYAANERAARARQAVREMLQTADYERWPLNSPRIRYACRWPSSERRAIMRPSVHAL